MDKLVCITDFQAKFAQVANRNAREYFDSGAGDEETLEGNRRAYLRWFIRPRVLVDVANRKMSTTVLGKPVAFPLGVSPTGFQKVAHPDGECAVARAAEAMGTIFVLSTFATSSIEEVATAAPKCRKWFQVFMNRDREASAEFIRRAERAGFEAIVLTVDAQIIGNRRANARNPFQFPAHLKLPNFKLAGAGAGAGGAEGLHMVHAVHSSLEQVLTWDIIKFVKSTTKLPVVIKGILTPEDAVLAVHHGVAAIWISNHGGRQLDTTPPTVDVLPEIARVVGSSCEIYVDGGVLRGSDVFKARALGATMAFAGRPLIWGLGVGGEAGARKVLEIFRDELDLTLALAGVPDVDEIRREAVVGPIRVTASL